MNRSIGRLRSKDLTSALKGVRTTFARAYAAGRRRREKRRALEVAMARFSMLHPHWHEAFFDESFMDRLPTGALDDIDATSLSREWARQFRYRDERRRDLDVKRLTPVAADFLALLASAEADVRTSRPPEPREREAVRRVGAAGSDVPAPRRRIPPGPCTAADGCC